MTHTLQIEGLPKYYQGGRSEGVLAVHGYTGRPGEMDYLAQSLHRQGWSVSVPRLPGHATSRSDLLRCTWKDWYRRVLDAYYDLRSCCDKVFVAGLSMGGLLTLMLAQEEPCDALALAAPVVLTTRQVPLSVSSWAGRLIQPKKLKDFEHQFEGEHSPEGRFLEDEYWSWLLPSAVGQLASLQRKTNARLKRVTAPTLVLTSKRDQVISQRAGEFLQKRLGSQEFSHIVYERSGHVITNDCEKQRAAEDITAWFNRFSSE